MGSLLPPDIHVVLIALPAFGHVRPVLALAANLVPLGYTVSVMTGLCFQERVEAVKGVEFVPLKGKADFDFEQPLAERYPDRPNGESTILFDMEHFFYASFHDQFESVKELIESPALRNRRTVIVREGSFPGTLPIALRSPQVRHVPIIGLGQFPIVVLSKDTAPPGPGLPSQGVEQNTLMNQGAIEMFAPLAALERSLCEQYKCAKPPPSNYHFNNWVLTCDIYCQLCVSEMELPRSDLPGNVRYCGTLTGHNETKKPQPEWFDEFVLGGDTTQPLILVTSGSIPGLNVNDLILPTIEACKDLPVRVVVCAVHVKYPAGEKLPGNVRWAEWIPFEDILPHTSLVVSSGGYGGICQSFANGVPMICAGVTEDKQHTSMLAAATGAAINLKTQTPTVEQVKTGVLEILKTTTYKEKAAELKKAYEKADPVKTIVEAIEEVSSKFYGGA